MWRWQVVFLMLGLLGTTEVVQGQSQPEPYPLDVEHYRLDVEIEPNRSFIRGEATVRFVPERETLTVSFQLNQHLSVLSVFDEEGVRLPLSAEGYSRDSVRVEGREAFRAGEARTLTFRFEGQLEPEQYAFLDVPLSQRAVIDREGAVLLPEGNWFPSHRLPLDAASSELRVVVPLGFTAVAPGRLEGIETLGLTEAFTWTSDGELTGVPLVVGRYLRQPYEELSHPLMIYVEQDFEGDLQPLAELIDSILEFYSEEYGPLPSSGLTLVQADRADEATPGSRGLVLLNEAMMAGPTLPVGELARRVALQWWGFSLRIARPSDAWLSDGFATYAGLRYLQERKPELYEAELAHRAVEALKYQETAPISGGLDLEPGSARYRSIVSGKGAWVLYMLGQLTGPDVLHGIIRDFYQQHAGRPATIGDFAALVERRAEGGYRWFFTQWIESIGVPEFRVDYTVFRLREGGFKIRGQVLQNLDLFRMPLDVLIETKGQAEEKDLMVNGKTTSFTFETETMPVRLEIDPKGKILMDSERMRVAVAIALGDEYRAAGEHVSAIQEYERAIDLNPRSSLAHFRLGETFFEQHSYSNAANSMRDCLNGDLKPEWVETWAHIFLGKVYDVLGQRQRALAEYQKAINSKNDYNGAQAEAERLTREPYTKPDSVIG